MLGDHGVLDNGAGFLRKPFGAVDFLAKPVWLNELALKAIFHLLRGRILAAI